MRGCRPLTDSEIQNLLEMISAPQLRRERALILLGLRTGMRLSSILSLRVGDVASAGRVRDRIRVRRATVKGKTMGYDMPLHPQAAAAVQDQLDSLISRSPSAFLFPGSRRGSRLHRTQGWRIITDVFATAGLVGGLRELGTHTLRKTFARLIYSALKNDLIGTCRAMRHSSVETTIEYLSFNEEEVDSAILNL